MTENPFESVMRARSDAELLLITTRDRADYVPEALLAAEAEWARRDLDAAQLQAAHVGVELLLEDRAVQSGQGDVWLGRLREVWRMLNPLENRGLELQLAVFSVAVGIWWLLSVGSNWSEMRLALRFWGIFDLSFLQYWWIAFAVPLGIWGIRIAQGRMAKQAGWVLLAVLMSEQAGTAGTGLMGHIHFNREPAYESVDHVPVQQMQFPLGHDFGPNEFSGELIEPPRWTQVAFQVEMPTVWDHVKSLGWFGLLLVFMGRKPMVVHCGVDNRTRWLALVVPFGMISLMGIGLFFL